MYTLLKRPHSDIGRVDDKEHVVTASGDANTKRRVLCTMLPEAPSAYRQPLVHKCLGLISLGEPGLQQPSMTLENCHSCKIGLEQLVHEQPCFLEGALAVKRVASQKQLSCISLGM